MCAKIRTLVLVAVACGALCVDCCGQVEIKPTQESLDRVIRGIGTKNQTILMRRPWLVWEPAEREIEEISGAGRSVRINGGDCIELLNNGRSKSTFGTVALTSMNTVSLGFSSKMFREWPSFTVEIRVRASSGAVLTGRGSFSGPSYVDFLTRWGDTDARVVESACEGYIGAVLLALVEIDNKLHRN
jgi:hypothetical protein